MLGLWRARKQTGGDGASVESAGPVAAASWCNGTPASKIGWKDRERAIPDTLIPTDSTAGVLGRPIRTARLNASEPCVCLWRYLECQAGPVASTQTKRACSGLRRRCALTRNWCRDERQTRCRLHRLGGHTRSLGDPYGSGAFAAGQKARVERRLRHRRQDRALGKKGLRVAWRRRTWTKPNSVKHRRRSLPWESTFGDCPATARPMRTRPLGPGARFGQPRSGRVESRQEVGQRLHPRT